MYTFQNHLEKLKITRGIQEERRKSKMIEINDIKITYLLIQIKINDVRTHSKDLIYLHHLVLLCL